MVDFLEKLKNDLIFIKQEHKYLGVQLRELSFIKAKLNSWSTALERSNSNQYFQLSNYTEPKQQNDNEPRPEESIETQPKQEKEKLFKKRCKKCLRYLNFKRFNYRF